ncbi:MAG: efflux RND transporter permease subunit, partial [bacterium]|nr:efflux RND transporter permease subunit [bacterium]
MNLPEFGVKRPVTNIMIFFAIIIIALYSVSRIGVDLFPEIESPVISVIATYPGASPQDVETNVIEPLENQLGTTPELDRMTAKCMEGVGALSLKFNWGTDLNEASNDIRDRIELAKRYLPDIPDEMENPFIFKFNTANMPILQIGIQAKETYRDLYDMVNDRIVDQLKQLPGVGTVQLYGGYQRQINIWVDNNKLKAYDFAISDIEKILRAENITQPVGNIETGLTDYLVRVPGEFKSPDEINYIILGEKNGKVVYLRDVARIEDGYMDLDMIVRIDKSQGLMMMVQKQVGTNTVQVAERVKKRLDELISDFPPDVNFKIIFDTSEDIVSSIDTLKSNLGYGILLVILVVWFFLRSVKSSFIIALTIPFSLLIAFVYLFVSGRTLNVISLSSLVIALGMVMDGAIVVVDNVTRHIDRGERPKEASVYGTMEIFSSIAASTLTTVVVFGPLLFASGVVGIMFGELAAIVIMTLVGSLFTCSTFTPMLCSKWFSRRLVADNVKAGGKNLFSPVYALSGGFLHFAESIYEKALGFSLNHKKLVIFIFFLVFVSSMTLSGYIGSEFIPEEDSGDLSMTAKLPVGTRVSETDKIASQLEDIMEKYIPEKRFIFARSGTLPGIAAAFGREMGTHICQAGVKTLKVTERKRNIWEIGQVVRERVEKIGGIIKLNIELGNPMSKLITGTGGKSVQIEVIGNSFEKTGEIGDKIADAMQNVEGAVDISISRELNRPEIDIEIDREKAAALGLNTAVIGETLKAYIEGSVASKYREEGDTYDIRVRMEESHRQSIEDVNNLAIVSPYTGQKIRLNNVAKIKETCGPLAIERKNRERVLTVECNTHARSTGEVVSDIKKEISKIAVPEGVLINFGGEAEEQEEAFRDLFVLLVMGIILVYMVMAAQFESFFDPFIVMFAIPFTFTGVIVAFVLTGTNLNVISFLGVVMLMGIVVNNAIVLISYINILRARGNSV